MEKDSEILAKVKGWFEAAATSPAYTIWREEARTAWDFYDGAQWSAEEADKLAENGQPALVVNKIATKVDNLAGTEISGRTRVVYRSRSGNAADEEAASVLTDLALFVAEQGEQAQEISGVFRAGLVSGIGWLDIGVADEKNGPMVFARAEDEMSVVWDPLSRRADLSDSRFVARERWLDEDAVKALFPHKASAVLSALEGSSPINGSAFAYGLLDGRREVNYIRPGERLFRLVEVQYRELVKQYRFRLADGTEVNSFDKADVKMSGGTLEDTVLVPRVYVAYFTGDTLLDNRPLEYRHNSFTLLPFVYKRHRADGRPYGLVRGAIDPQRELNKRRSKAMHLLNTAQIIADIDAVEDPALLAREAARPDGVILKRAGKDLRILRNLDLAASQVQVMEQAGRDIQDVMGVYDENLGRQSNAVSGTAIQQRQSAGSMNQMFAFDGLRRLKKHLGEQVMELVKQYFTNEMVIAITDDFGSSRSIHLNEPVVDIHGNVVNKPDGTPLTHPDFSGASFDVVVEEVRDVASARELDAERLQLLIKAGVPVPPAVLVEASGVKEKEAILAALQGQQASQQSAVQTDNAA
jgi:hypothetical protein